MLDTLPARPVQVRPSPRATTPAGDDADSLLDAIGPVDGARVLLVGGATLDLMCASIRRGCESVATLRAIDRPEAASADLVFVSAAASSACALGGKADSLPARLMRALAPLGTLVVQLDPDAGPLPATASRIAQALRLHGFSAIRTETLRDCRTLLFAERPLNGPLNRCSDRV